MTAKENFTLAARPVPFRVDAVPAHGGDASSILSLVQAFLDAEEISVESVRGFYIPGKYVDDADAIQDRGALLVMGKADANDEDAEPVDVGVEFLPRFTDIGRTFIKQASAGGGVNACITLLVND